MGRSKPLDRQLIEIDVSGDQYYCRSSDPLWVSGTKISAYMPLKHIECLVEVYCRKAREERRIVSFVLTDRAERKMGNEAAARIRGHIEG